MNRRVFVGSSTESLDKATNICETLSKVDSSLESSLWKKWFEPGFLTFEVLEEMLGSCCGAVFVATPDDRTIVRGREIACPRGNVLLEFGLVAGRLGRHNVAVCQYGGAVLPSDLKGLTVIEMDGPDSKEAEEKLRIWASRLYATADTISRTQLVHGYTGRWEFNLQLHKWRDVPIRPHDYAQVKGSLGLYLAATGQTGNGLAHARLFFKLTGQDSGAKIFQGEYHTSYEITDAFCHTDGSLEFTTQAFALQKVYTRGVPPLELEGLDIQPEPWSSRWKLAPGSEPRSLEGSVITEGTGITEGRVVATKIDLPA